MSGSGISWAICKSAPRSRQITTPAPHHSVFTGRMPFLPPSQQCQSTEGVMTTQPPLYRSACVSRHLQLRTGGFCRCKVFLPACPSDANQRIRTREKTLEFSSEQCYLHCLRTPCQILCEAFSWQSLERVESNV